MTLRESADEITSTPKDPDEITAYRARIVELEQRLDDLTRLVSDLVWDVDADLRVSYISERVFDILGYIPRELIGKSILELGSFEDEAPISAPDVFRRAFRNRRFVILDKQSRAHTFRISGIPVFDLDTGSYLGARGTADDDTDRRAAEQALRDGERRYRMLVEHSPHAMHVVDERGILFANATAARLFGAASPQSLIGLHPRDLILPEDHKIVHDRRTRHEASPDGFELRRVRLDGSVFYTLNFSVEIEWEDRVARLITIFDLTDYKNAQAALTESEQRFRDFAQSAADRFWETDQNHRIVFTSAPRDRDVLWGEGGMMGRLRWSTPALDSHESKWQDLRRDMEQHLPIRNFRYRVNDSAQAVRYLRVNGVPVFDAAGTFSGYRGTTIDETAEVLARQEAEGTQHLLRLTTDSVPAFIGYHDRETRFRYANSFYKRIVGGETDDLIGKTIADVFGPEMADQCDSYIQQALNGRAVKYDAEFETLDGQTIHAETNFIPDFEDDGSVDGFFVMSLDITERKRAENERERTRLALEAAQRLAHIGSFERIFEPDHLYWTRELYHIHGLDPNGPPVTFELFLQHVHPSDRARVQRVLDKAMRNQQRTFSLEYRAVRPDGVERNVAASGEFTYDPDDGTALSLIGSIQDITTQKRIQAALERAKLDAETANRAKTEFLSSMSHELRTPMNAVLGYAQLLLQNKKEPISTRQQRQINQILKSGQHLLNLINDILDLSRIESGRVELAMKDLELEKLISECLSLIEAMATRNRISIQNLTRHKPALTVHCDDVRLKQALVNLLSNAIKFNQPGGRVIIDQEERRDGAVRISITDTGNGIPASRHRELFEPFSRLDATQRGIEGTGIGLAISKQLIERMGGRVGFTSEVGVGSTFWIEVPSASHETGDAENPSAAPSDLEPAFKIAAGGLRQLLYVEDDESNLRLLEEVISHIPNLSLLAAPDAESGIRVAMDARPDIIVMDINLPGMSGFEAIERLKGQPETQNIPVIALSAAAMSKDIQKGAEAGFFAYLTKPFVIDELLTTIDRALAGAGAATDAAAQ